MFTRIVWIVFIGATAALLSGCGSAEQSSSLALDRPAPAMAAVTSAPSSPLTDSIPSGALVGAKIEFLPLDPKQVSAQGEIIGGAPADVSQWPASFAATIKGADGLNYLCTATLIGPQVLLTAGHCVADHSTISVTYKGQTPTAKCTHHTDYDSTYDQDVKDKKNPSWEQRKNGVSADFSLCLLSAPISDVIYETPLINANQLQIGQTILLAGFGCVTAQKQPSYDPATGKYVFRIGTTKAVSLPQGLYLYLETETGASICPGDSGGAAYLAPNSVGGRRIVAVNSRVSTDSAGNVTGHSYLSSLAAPNVANFISKWSKDNHAPVCGYGQPSQCRTF